MPRKRKAPKDRILGLLRVVVALAILGFIAKIVPWKDELIWHGPDTDISVFGEIQGQWQQETIRFRPDPDTVVEPGWPEESRAALRNTAEVAAAELPEFQRRAGDTAGFDWRPSITRAFRDMNRGLLALAMGLFITASIIVATRWWRLLLLAGCPSTWFGAVRLTYIGFCFNLVMPGMTGGDVVKGVLAAKEHPQRRADAVVSVVVDRVIGLAALAVLAVVVILLSGNTFAALRAPLLLLIGSGIVGALFYGNKKLRRKVGLSALVDRLPLGDKLRALDEAALFYLKHPIELVFAFGFSVMNHMVMCLGVFVLALAIGVTREQAGFTDFLVLAPVANMVGALPVAPGGWGLGELVYKELFEMIQLSGDLGVVVSVTFRLCTLVGLGLLGSLFLLLPGARAEVREMDTPGA